MNWYYRYNVHIVNIHDLSLLNCLDISTVFVLWVEYYCHSLWCYSNWHSLFGRCYIFVGIVSLYSYINKYVFAQRLRKESCWHLLMHKYLACIISSPKAPFSMSFIQFPSGSIIYYALVLLGYNVHYRYSSLSAYALFLGEEIRVLNLEYTHILISFQLAGAMMVNTRHEDQCFL